MYHQDSDLLSSLEQYRSEELKRCLTGVVGGLPIALVVNTLLLIGLTQLGKGISPVTESEIPIDILVTEVVEPADSAVAAITEIVQPPSPEVAQEAPIVAENPPPPPEKITPPPSPVAKTPEVKSPLPSAASQTTANFSPLSTLLKDVLPSSGATETTGGDTETPASEGSGSSFAPGSGTAPVNESGVTSGFADRIRGLLRGSGSPRGNATAALPDPPPPPAPVQNTNRFGCVQCEKPSFPSGAKERGVQGEAKVSVDVDANGNVIGVRLLNSSGHPELDQAAIEQAKKWRFTPSEGGKQGVSARVDFQIEGTDYQRQSQERQRQREEQRRLVQPQPAPEKPVTVAPPIRESVPEPVTPPPRSVEPPAPAYESPPETVAAPPPPEPTYIPEPVAPPYEPPPEPPLPVDSSFSE